MDHASKCMLLDARLFHRIYMHALQSSALCSEIRGKCASAPMLHLDLELLVLATFVFVLAQPRISITCQPARSHGTGHQFVTDLG